MTVASSLARSGPYICDGAQDTFPFNFPVLDPSHVAVYTYTGNTESRISEGFTVSLTENGGNVTFETAPAKDTRIAILRDTPFDQQVDLQNNTAFYPELLESMSDKLTMLVQQLREELSRCVKLAVASGESPESVVAMILGAKDMALDSASTAASAAAACSSAQLTIATIWSEITGDSASAEEAIDALKEAWEAAGSVKAAAEAGKASVNEASLAAVEYAKGQITEAQDASLGVLSATTKSRKEELLALIAETVGAEGSVAAAVQAAKDAAAAAGEETGKIQDLSESVQASISAAVTVADQKRQEAQTAANEAAAQAEAAGDSAAEAYSYIAQTLANKNAAQAAQAAAEAAKADAVAAAGSASDVANASITAHNASTGAHSVAFSSHDSNKSSHAAAFSSHDSNTNAHAAAFGKYTALGVLGAIPDLPDGSDLNQVTSGNFFGYRDYTYSNVPTGANVEFFLENLKSGTGSRLIQRLTDRNDNTYIRHKWGTEWTSWMKIMREDSLMTLPPAISDSSNHQVNSWWVHSLLADKFANSLGDQGFQKFYNGTIIQWGYSTVSTSGTTLSFPTAFPNAVKGILAVSCNASGVPSSAVPVATGRISNAQFSLRATASCGAYWFAIGY